MSDLNPQLEPVLTVNKANEIEAYIVRLADPSEFVFDELDLQKEELAASLKKSEKAFFNSFND